MVPSSSSPISSIRTTQKTSLSILFIFFSTILTSCCIHAFHPFPSDFSSGGSPSLIPPRSAASSDMAGNGNYGGGDDDEFLTGVMGNGEEHETVEERAAAWRQFQQDKYEHLTPTQAASPTDEEGRMKLLASVSRGSISFFFFILMWRSVHHFELADQTFKGIQRLLFVLPTVSLFILNMAGCVAGFTSPSHGAKKKMKAILNLNKLVELILIVYNVVRLTIVPSGYTPREIYVGRTLSNFIFLVQCQLFTKVTWGAAQIKQEQASMMPSSSTSADNYYNSGEQQQQQQQPYEESYNYEEQQQQQQQQQSYGDYQQQWDTTSGANGNEEGGWN